MVNVAAYFAGRQASCSFEAACGLVALGSPQGHYDANSSRRVQASPRIADAGLRHFSLEKE
jgi:hypothetical protein